ncbi:MAG: hypothetical protein KIC92_05660 [Clostridiales bacterium]|nr:hypothetical protein [Clostridiales bacterium]
MDKKYYIVIDGKKYEVSEDIYHTYYRSREKERYFMFVKKRGKIIIEDEKVVFKDSLEVSFEKLEELGLEIKDDFNLEDCIMQNLDIEVLKYAINKLSSEEYQIILELFYNCKSERELAKELNCCNVVLHNKKKKILNKLKKYFQK